ncbi:MAG: hypothetical protein LBR17_09140 [Bacteroidales bacterium]|jgi:hypothetical protein|nr:hypothetical protein [Bacteroidales bacterium]
MKRLCICVLLAVLPPFYLTAQVVKSEPVSKDTEAQIRKILLAERLSDFLKSGNINAGCCYIGNVFHFISVNPTEGVRLRLSGGINLENGISAYALGAWGTKDKDLKYMFSGSYRFKVATDVQNTISVLHSDNTYLPFLDGYDHILNSTWRDKDFFLLRKKTYGISNATKFQLAASNLTITASLSRNRNFKYVPDAEKEGFIPVKANFLYPSLQIKLAEGRNNASEQVIISRFPLINNSISLSCGGEFFVWDADVSNRWRASLNGKYRLPINDLRFGCLDFQVEGGYISKDVSRGGLFYPSSQIGYLSRSYAFLVMPYSQFANTRFAFVAMAFNSGGLLLNNIKFFRKFHGNEFLTCKAYFADYKPYYEISAGLDNILDLLGFEIAYSSLNQWGAFLRLRISDF